MPVCACIHARWMFMAQQYPKNPSSCPQERLQRGRKTTFFHKDGKEGIILLQLDTVSKVFAHILVFENPTLQTKNEDWGGEVVDAEGEIQDWSTMRAINCRVYCRITEGLHCEMRLKEEIRPLLIMQVYHIVGIQQ